MNYDPLAPDPPRKPKAQVHFSDDVGHKEADPVPDEVPSMSDLLGVAGDVSYVAGVSAATKAIADLLYNSGIRINNDGKEQLEVWLAHVVSRSPNCTCDIETDWDNGYDLNFCPWYNDKANQRLWYLAYYGLTEEELAEREREAQRQKAAAAERLREELKAERLKRLHQLAKEFEVDPKYLP